MGMDVSNWGLWLDRLFRWLLAGVFLVAGLPKLFAPYEFAEIVAAYGLVPDPLVLPIALLLPLVEVIAACMLVLNCPKGLLLAAALLLVFIAVLSYAIANGLDIDCGCFGPADPEHRAFAGLWTSLVRDLLLSIPVGFSFWYNRHKRHITEQQGGTK